METFKCIRVNDKLERLKSFHQYVTQSFWKPGEKRINRKIKKDRLPLRHYTIQIEIHALKTNYNEL